MVSNRLAVVSFRRPQRAHGAAQVHESEQKCKDQQEELASLRSELQKSTARARELDNRLQRYSSVTSLIHSLAKDPENATQSSGS